MPFNFDEMQESQRVVDFSTQMYSKELKSFCLTNEQGLKVELSNYGARLTRLLFPDKHGLIDDLVLGYEDMEAYVRDEEVYFGAIIGRYANRIADGCFEMEGKRYDLDKNHGCHHIHGGLKGFHNVLWQAEQQGTKRVVFRHFSEEGESGYPAALAVIVTYSLNAKSELRIDYEALASDTTIFNPTHHSYFNLAGAGKNSIHSHLLQVNADAFTPVNKALIPTGEIRSVVDTPFDFRESKEIGRYLQQDDQQLLFAGGYDHNFVLNKNKKNALDWAATVIDPTSGRTLDVLTTEPGLQVYSSNALDGQIIGREGLPYNKHSALCLETQHYPDSPNQTAFPSVILPAGQKFHSSTVYRLRLID